MSAPAAAPAPKAPAPSFNTLRASGLQNIFSTMTTAGKNLGSIVKNRGSSVTQQVFTEENGSYALSVIFWLMLYLFIGFLVAIFVHYSVTPIFRFSPGQKGLIGIPGASDDKVYWNERVQPLPLSVAPLLPRLTTDPTATASGVLAGTDDLATYPFLNDFSFSIDVLLRKLNESDSPFTDGGQVLLIKSGRPKGATTTPASIFDEPSGRQPSISDYYKERANMILYVNQTNDLICSFFVAGEIVSTRPIKNVPVYQPFRITVVVENKTFTLYLNGKVAFQQTRKTGIIQNTNSSFTTKTNSIIDGTYNCFYTPPDWQSPKGKSVFLQNFHLWPRAISYGEVTHAKPALATVPDFDAPQEVAALCVAAR